MCVIVYDILFFVLVFSCEGFTGKAYLIFDFFDICVCVCV